MGGGDSASGTSHTENRRSSTTVGILLCLVSGSGRAMTFAGMSLPRSAALGRREVKSRSRKGLFRSSAETPARLPRLRSLQDCMSSMRMVPDGRGGVDRILPLGDRTLRTPGRVPGKEPPVPKILLEV